MSLTVTTGGDSGTYRILAALSQLQTGRNATMTRLATGHRINKASDDPAGLIALSSLNGELTAINAALDNDNRSQSMLDVVDGTLTEMNSLVGQIQDLVLRASGSSVSASEKAAYQTQIDASIDSIDRLVNAASFNGKKLFNGENRITAVTNSTPSIKNINVYSRNPNVTGNVALSVNVTAAATRGSAVTTATTAATLSAATTIQVTGKLGTATIALASSTTGVNIMAAIVAQKSITGVSAAAQGANIAIMSTTTGSDSFVSVQVLDGSNTFMGAATVNKTIGVDARVKVNGETANAQGTEVFYTGGGVSLGFNLAKNVVNANLTVTISGGGATFQLGSSTATRSSLGIGGVNTAELGRSDIGYLSDLRSGGSQNLNVSGNNALLIAQDAATQVATAAARIGGFNKYQVGSSIRSLEAAQAGVTDAINQIDGTDFAADTSLLERQNILMNAAVSLLSMANAQQSSVLALLR